MIFQGVRQELARQLRADVDEDIWDYLVERGFVDEALLVESMNSLIEEYQRLRAMQRTGRRRSGSPQPSELPPDERLNALSRWLARQAAERPDVRAFRDQDLDGKLLEPTQVSEWIESHVETDGTPTPSLTVTVPEGHEVEFYDDGYVGTSPPLTISREMPAFGVRGPEILVCALPGIYGGITKPVARGGTLDILRGTAASLSDRFEWNESLATLFVLTGLVPPIPRARIRYRFHPGLPTGERVLLDVDSSLSPKQVMDLYRRARTKLPFRQGQRYRSMETKAVALAEFFDTMQEGSWKERMKTWNTEHSDPKWQYTEVRNFARDCKHAARRLFGEED